MRESKEKRIRRLERAWVEGRAWAYQPAKYDGMKLIKTKAYKHLYPRDVIEALLSHLKLGLIWDDEMKKLSLISQKELELIKQRDLKPWEFEEKKP